MDHHFKKSLFSFLFVIIIFLFILFILFISYLLCALFNQVIIFNIFVICVLIILLMIIFKIFCAGLLLLSDASLSTFYVGNRRKMLHNSRAFFETICPRKAVTLLVIHSHCLAEPFSLLLPSLPTLVLLIPRIPFLKGFS
jgi:hypothetical protein